MQEWYDYKNFDDLINSLSDIPETKSNEQKERAENFMHTFRHILGQEIAKRKGINFNKIKNIQK